MGRKARLRGAVFEDVSVRSFAVIYEEGPSYRSETDIFGSSGRSRWVFVFVLVKLSTLRLLISRRS